MNPSPDKSGRLRSNITANFIGSLWTALMSILFVPLYIRFMGIEAYGLVGFFVTLQAVLGLLDMGLAVTLNREMARLSIRPGKEQEMRDMVRTLESFYWAVGLIMGVLVAFLAPWIAHRWVNASALPPSAVQQAIMIMGLVLAFQWPSSLYSGGLQGLQRQVRLNFINIAAVTLRGVGAILVLWLISPTVQAFFLWQICISALLTTTLAWSLWRLLPDTSRPAMVRASMVRGIWRFAAGMSGSAVAGVCISQLDKIVLSKLLPLEQFGYYAFASALAYSLYRLVVPFTSALFPQFTQLASSHRGEELIKLYHGSCQLISIIVLPVSFTAALYSREILTVWTQNAEMAEHTHRILSFLVSGTCVSCLMMIPGILQGSHGWTRLTFFQNVCGLLVMLPLLVWMTDHFGVVGASSAWLILSAGYFLTIPTFLHKKLLIGEKRAWYIGDVGLPLIAAAIPAVACRWVIPESTGTLEALAWLAIVYLLSLGSCFLVADRVRHPAMLWFRQQFASARP